MTFKFKLLTTAALLALPALAGAQVAGSADTNAGVSASNASPPLTDEEEAARRAEENADQAVDEAREEVAEEGEAQIAAEAQPDAAAETPPVETQADASAESQAQPSPEAQPVETQAEVAAETQPQPAPETQPVEIQAEVATGTEAATVANPPAQQPADAAMTQPAPAAPAQQPAATAQTQTATQPAQRPAATAQTQPAPAAQPAPVGVATAADIRAGAPVLDPQGGTVGTIESVAADGAVVATGTARARIPLASFGKSDRGLVISVTRAQLEAAVSAQSPS